MKSVYIWRNTMISCCTIIVTGVGPDEVHNEGRLSVGVEGCFSVLVGVGLCVPAGAARLPGMALEVAGLKLWGSLPL